MNQVKLGPFSLPGIQLDQALTDAQLEEITQWCQEKHCGTIMNNKLISFKKTKERDWFILRFADTLNSNTDI